MKQNGRFRHESLQDKESIKSLLKAVTNGIGAGKITLEDENGNLVLVPGGLLRLKINASVDDDQNKLDIRISWQGDTVVGKDKTLKIK